MASTRSGENAGLRYETGAASKYTNIDKCAHPSQLAEIADSWSKKVGFEAGIDDPELKKAFIKAGKQARREAYVQPSFI